MPTPAGWGVGALRPPAVGPVVIIAAVVKERAPLVVVVVKVVMGKAPLDSRLARIRSPTLRRAAPVAQDSNGREPHHKDSRSLVGSLAGGSWAFRDDGCDLLRDFGSDFHPGRSFVDPVVTVGSATTGSVRMADVALGARSRPPL